MGILDKSISILSVGLLSATILSGCGGGSGGGSSSTKLPGLITASAIVDVNGDGKSDVIISSQGDGYSSPQVLINNGNGSSFTIKNSANPTQYKGANGSAVDIQAGDFNNDGKIDLLVSTVDTSPASFYSSSQTQLYLGAGNGTFTDATSNIANSVSANWISNIRVADFDGDGFLDFATTTLFAVNVYLNDRTGKFTISSISINNGGVITTQPNIDGGELLVGDLSNDGKPDLVSFSACFCSYINTSTPGTFSFTQISAGLPTLAGGILLDINGDGKLDLVGSTNISGSPLATVPVVAFQGDGLGGFTSNNALLSPQPALVHGRQFLAADFNGDGKQDVLIADHGYDAGTFPGARNWLLINDGAGKLVDQTAANLDLLAGYTHQASIGDLNGDGKPELLLNNSSNCNGTTLTCVNEPRFWLNNGVGKFTSYSPILQ
jgi:hypothetical protein